METLLTFLELMGNLIRGVLRLDPAVYEAALETSIAGFLSLFILFLAGMSDTIGNSVVLFANRVPRRRFLLAIFVEALTFVVGVLLWAGSIWLMAGLIFDAWQPYYYVVRVVALGYAPLLFGFLILLPYLGNIIFVILRIWMLLAVLVGVSVDYGFGLLPALVCTVLGWFLLTLLTRLPFLRLERIDDFLWRFSTGRSLELDAQEAVALYIEEVRSQASNEGGS